MKSGTSLVELMIATAIVGIVAGGVSSMAGRAELEGFAVLERERALLLLEYRAACASEGREIDPEVVTRLVATLPDAKVTEESAGKVTTLTVEWHSRLGAPAVRSLAVFTP